MRGQIVHLPGTAKRARWTGFSGPVRFSTVRHSGSTTAALVSLIHTVLSLLGTNQYVRVIALDFSKAFDTVRHIELFGKLAKMNLPDAVYNWVQDFYCGRSHIALYTAETSHNWQPYSPASCRALAWVRHHLL